MNSQPTTLPMIDNPSNLLQQAIRECSNLEMDWLWYAGQMVDDSERGYCYARALYINPRSRTAQDGLAAFASFQPQRDEQAARRFLRVRRA